MADANFYRLIRIIELSCRVEGMYLEYLLNEMQICSLTKALMDFNHNLFHCHVPHRMCCCGYQATRTRPSMTKKQWDTLFEPNPADCHSYNGDHPCQYQVRSTLDLDDLDLSILHLIYKNVLPPADRADMKAISTILDLRNMLAHSSILSIDDAKFEDEWQKAKFATLQLAGKLPNLQYSKIDHDIEGLKTKSLDKGECERLLTAMKLFRDTDTILQVKYCSVELN